MKLTPIAANQTEVELADGTTVFFSYKTPVAAHVPGEGYYKTDKIWSYCIDWDRAAEDLKMDYSAIDFDGVTYYVR